MSPVNWLEQRVSDLPAGDLWLSAAESLQRKRLRIEKRRSEWTLGRWTAKRAVAAFLRMPPTPDNLALIELVPGSDGAPVAWVNGAIAHVAVSISHCDGTGMCALGAPGHSVGCDIERIQHHSAEFIASYFTDDEQQAIRCSPLILPSLLWSAKESVMKLLHTGLRIDTRVVSVTLTAAGEHGGWRCFRAAFSNETTFRGWWRIGDAVARTVAAFPPAAAPPVPLAQGFVDAMADYILPFGKIRALQLC